MYFSNNLTERSQNPEPAGPTRSEGVSAVREDDAAPKPQIGTGEKGERERSAGGREGVQRVFSFRGKEETNKIMTA